MIVFLQNKFNAGLTPSPLRRATAAAAAVDAADAAPVVVAVEEPLPRGASRRYGRRIFDRQSRY